MTQDISSLMDGELEAQEAERAIRSCCASEEHKDIWYLYHVIGDTMRGQAPRDMAKRASLLAKLEKEPTVLAPRRRIMESPVARIAFAAAASVATVGVVSWIGMQGGAPGTATPVVVKNAPVPTFTQPVAAKTTAPAAAPSTVDVQDYLAAHRQIPSPEAYRPVANLGAPAR